MRHIPDQLNSRKSGPFKKRHGKYNIPGMTSEHEILMDRVNPVEPEEQGFIRHYLGYADAFLRSVEHIVPEPLEGPAPKMKPRKMKPRKIKSRKMKTKKKLQNSPLSPKKTPPSKLP